MHESPLVTLDHRILALTTRILATWGVDPRHQAALLGWDAPRLEALLSGTAPAHQSPEQLKRLLLTMELIRALHGRYGQVEAWWLHRPNQAAPFDGRTPVEYLASGGLGALQATVEHLDDALRGRVPPSAEAVALASTLPQPDITLEDD